MLYISIAFISALIGFVIGICGVSGFLLPLFLMNYCGYPPAYSLFISYCVFLIGGAIGVRNYYARGEVPMNIALPLGTASLAGAFCGAWVGRFYISSHISTVLYTMVLISGIMIFVQDLFIKKIDRQAPRIPVPVLAMVGFLTALICSMSGAGGPVIVMPLLVLMGFPIRYAIGIAMFDSLFISVPALLMYGNAVPIRETCLPLMIAALSQSAGILAGSRMAGKIPQKPVKYGVALFSILFALWKIYGKG